MGIDIQFTAAKEYAEYIKAQQTEIKEIYEWLKTR